MTTFGGQDKPLPETLEDCHTELVQLRAAMHSRPVIDQAKGILIARHSCTADEAFVMLSEASQRANRKLRDIAVDVVASEQRTLPNESEARVLNERPATPEQKSEGGKSDNARLQFHR